MQASRAADVTALLNRLFAPGRFVTAPPLQFAWRSDFAATIPWELHEGRLLSPAHARRVETFRSWTMTQVADGALAGEPTIALRWQEPQRVVHVTRGLLCHVQEAYDSGDNVILTRGAARWTSELVASLFLDDFSDAAALAGELTVAIGLAVIGTSRLPLTSLEAPLPDFVLGRLAYLDHDPPDPPAPPAPSSPMSGWRALLQSAPWGLLGLRDRAKALEFALRAAAPDDIGELIERLPRGDGTDIAHLLRIVFNEVSLSPFTGFVGNALALTRELVGRGIWPAVEEVDFFAWLLRQIGRHLTAYDLVTFHHRGANYPDALVLDAVLTRYGAAVEDHPELFEGDAPQPRLRRRALRQACLLRRGYEGHPVPDAPTSPGENARVLPAPFRQVPDEQLLNPLRRERRLFAADPLAARLSAAARRVLAGSLADLSEDIELVELGTGVFIDRPFGLGKTGAEPDQTLLLAHAAFSAAVAERRTTELQSLADELDLAAPGWDAGLVERLRRRPPTTGLPLEVLGTLGRPVASLIDARRVSEDFVVTRTLRGQPFADGTDSAACHDTPHGELFRVFDWQPLWQRFELNGLRRRLRWIVRLKLGADPGVLALMDDGGVPGGGVPGGAVPRVLFESDPGAGYRLRGGVEFPRAGLRVWHVRDDSGRMHDLRDQDVRVRARG